MNRAKGFCREVVFGTSISLLCAGTLVCLTEAKGTYYRHPLPISYGNRYNLYTSGSSPQLTPEKPLARHKIYCAYVVQRNVTCTLQDGVESYVKAEYHKCSWGPKCPGKVVYHTFFRPRYKIGYKTVTEIAWKCCPGLVGEGCHHDNPTNQAGIPSQHPSPKMPPTQKMFPGPRVPPHPKIPVDSFPIPKKNNYGRKMPNVFGDRLDHLEGEVRRLSQSYDTLYNMVSGLGDHLRLAIQEDTSKMIGSLMNSPTVPDSTMGFGIIPDGIVDAADKAELSPYPPVGEILGKVTEMSDSLKIKTNLLEEVHGLVLDHDGQIKHLMESARPSPLTSIDMLEEYIDNRLSNLRVELLDGFEKKMINIQSTCDYQIKEVKQQCEEEKAANLRLQQILDGKELEIKKDISQLETQIQGLTVVENCCSNLNYLTVRMDILEKGLHSISESQKNLHSRVDNELSPDILGNLFEGHFVDLEARLNFTEREIGNCCSNVEDNMRGLMGSELDGTKVLFENKIRTLEERLITIVGDVNNVSSAVGLDGAVMPFLEGELAIITRETDEKMEVLQSQLTNLESTCLLGCTSKSKDVEIFRTEIEECQNKNQDLLLRMDSNSDLLQKLNITILEMQRRIEEETAGTLQGEITLLKINLNTMTKSLTGLKDSVSQYSDSVLHVNSSLDDHERKIEDEVHSLQEKISNQDSQLFFSNKRVLNLKGDLERLRSRIINDLSNCKSQALGLQKEVIQFDDRMAQIEDTCGRLGTITGSLEHIRSELENNAGSMWGYTNHINKTLATHSEEITVLKNNLLDCQAKVTELSEDVGILEGKLKNNQH
ncbi:EMILIN-3 [Notechis scutatus]|uniref:EMILIN-3 n=1 Tax=Notechis scutatus TaxID=8663 RepID=A0A6J1TPY1_9SAUR|nr:EMILIN-3 [Notechis scutatus]